MKLNLTEKIKSVIDTYKSNMTVQHDDIKQMLEPYKTKGHRYTVDGLKQEIGEQMEEIMSNWKKYDTVLNQKVKEIISSAKVDVLKVLGITNTKNPDDYATKINNAIQFMKMTLDDADTNDVASLDAELHSILKDFIDDFDTMNKFKKMVERKIPNFINSTGDCIFPNTFGKWARVKSIMNTLEDLEAAAEMLFIHKRTDSQEVIKIQGLGFALPMDGYSEANDEQMIVDAAVILDGLANNIDIDGQSNVSGSGQLIDM